MKTMRLFSSLGSGPCLDLALRRLRRPGHTHQHARRSRQAGQCPGRQSRLSGASHDAKVDDLQVGTGAEAVDGKKVCPFSTPAGWSTPVEQLVRS